MRINTKAALFLLFFAPINAELLTASAPPLEFFTPFGLVFLVLYYGSAAIIINELATRWNKGWPSILLLGMAYGIIEEGLNTMSFFNPNWMDVGVLGEYGRALDVNWVWSFNLTIFHAVYSISIPILAMRLLFPTVKKQRLLSNETFGFIVIIFVLIATMLTIIISLAFAYVAPPIQYISAIAAIVLLGYIAKKAPENLLAVRSGKPGKSSLMLGLAGFSFTLGFFFINFASPYVLPSPIMPIALLVLLSSLTWWYIEKNMGVLGNERHKVALIAGIESVWIFMAFLHELAPAPGSPGAALPIGMSLVGIGYIAFLLFMRSRALKSSD